MGTGGPQTALGCCNECDASMHRSLVNYKKFLKFVWLFPVLLKHDYAI